MRIRTIKPEFFSHEALFDAERETGLPLRLCYIGLWCACDRAGRFRWEPRRLKAAIMPYDDVDFSRVLDALTTRGFVVRYTVSRVDYGCVPSFSRHQVINNRERESDIPDVSEGQIHSDACPTRAPRVNDACPTPLCNAQGEGKGREGKGKEGNGSLPPNILAGGCAPELEGLQADEPQAEPAKTAKPRQRDPLFDALASACGADPLQMTAPAARSCGVALAAIRKVSPAITPDEFAPRAEVYRRKYRDAALTPSALCTHWAECDASYAAPRKEPTSLPEPRGWREWLEQTRPGNLHNAENRPWSVLPESIQKEFLQRENVG